MDITLYESGTSRSARCRWTLEELGLDYQSISRPGLIRSDEVKALHPLGKLPAARIDGQPLFESAAICTYLADQVEVPNIIPARGSWARALHDQWVSFALTEMEAWLWNSAVNQFVLPEEQRVTAGLEQNRMMFQRSVVAVEAHLSAHPYFIEDRFTVCDIIIGWTLNWGRRQNLLDEFPATQRYVKSLLVRDHCALAAN